MIETREIQDEEGLRREAVLRLRKRREFTAHVLAYVMVNATLVMVWALTGASFFWPIFPLMGWGIGLVFHAWDVYRAEPSEDDIRREIARIRRASRN
jgi:hypothetical protein